MNTVEPFFLDHPKNPAKLVSNEGWQGIQLHGNMVGVVGGGGGGGNQKAGLSSGGLSPGVITVSVKQINSIKT